MDKTKPEYDTFSLKTYRSWNLLTQNQMPIPLHYAYDVKNPISFSIPVKFISYVSVAGVSPLNWKCFTI